MKTQTLFSSLLLVLILASPGLLRAQETSGSFTDGSIQIGFDNRACDGTLEGAIRYCSSSGTVQFCGPAQPLCGSSPSPGDVCEDGSVYAGSLSGTRLFVPPADNSSSKEWNNANGSGYTTTSTVSYTDGTTNTATLITLDSDSGTGGTQPHKAAQLCADSTALDHDDWYLPAMDELNVLYTNKVAIGGFYTGSSWPQYGYWSSSEANNSGARFIDFRNGTYSSTYKEDDLSLRCVRQDTANPCWSDWGGDCASCP